MGLSKGVMVIIKHIGLRRSVGLPGFLPPHPRLQKWHNVLCLLEPFQTNQSLRATSVAIGDIDMYVLFLA